MSREKQIEEMAKVIQEGELDRNRGDLDCTEFPTDVVIKVGLQRLAGAKALYNAGYRKQEWISVDERLPDPFDNVLVYDGAITIDHISIGHEWYYHNHDAVTHWMPLPEAPKMKGGAE